MTGFSLPSSLLARVKCLTLGLATVSALTLSLTACSSTKEGSGPSEDKAAMAEEGGEGEAAPADEGKKPAKGKKAAKGKGAAPKKKKASH